MNEQIQPPFERIDEQLQKLDETTLQYQLTDLQLVTPVKIKLFLETHLKLNYALTSFRNICIKHIY